MRRTVPTVAPTLALALVVCLAAATAAPGVAEPSGNTGGRPAVGDPAPPLALPSTTGEIHDLQELRRKKDVIVVFFRGAW